MKQLLMLGLALLAAQLSFGQLNMSILSQVQYDDTVNDVWGYVAPDGTEYAIVGLQNGVSIVSLADPENAEEVALIPGQSSTWRDIKTWGDWAYVTTDQNGTTEGLTVIDLRDLPESAPFYHWTPDLPGLGTLETCHNIYIDENGYAYLAGCNVNSGGMLFIDVFSTPGEPIFVGPAPSVYAHDVFVRDNIMYSSEIYEGTMTIYDVSDKQNSVLLGSQATPLEFTHNIWISDDSQVAYTTDERPNAPVAAYDISDYENIEELDQFRPVETLGTNVIPHNVHVWNDWLIISYYSDGGIIVDASRPENLIEVGNFDTFLSNGAGFNGAWGAYPFLPSGAVLVSDRGNGLFVLDAVYVRACWLEGLVTDAVTGDPINGVEVTIAADQANLAETEFTGRYETGLATAGEYEVTFLKEGYAPLTVTTDLDNGMLTELDVQLQPLLPIQLNGLTQELGNGVPVAGASIVLQNEVSTYVLTSDESGAFNLDGFYEGSYQVLAGAWGYQLLSIEELIITGGENVVLNLQPGYEDDFAIDLGWQVTSVDQDGSNLVGEWELGEPQGTFRGDGTPSNPDFDLEDDFGDQCYVTGNGGGSVGSDDVDDGSTTLTSPVMDLTGLGEPILSYSLWFYNAGGSSEADDELVITLSNGSESVVLETVANSTDGWQDPSVFVLSEVIEITDNMTISFETSDFDPTGHLVEAAVDGFRVTDGAVNTTDILPIVDWSVAPNPFAAQTTVNYSIPTTEDQVQLELMNAWGQRLRTYRLGAQTGTVTIQEDLPAGFYFLQMTANGQLLDVKKIVKQ